MDLPPVLQFIANFGYWIAVPIMILEGPIITIVMGFLSSFNLFNIYVVISLGVIADLISDAIYYWSGYHGGPKVMEKLKIPQLKDNQGLQVFKEKFERHPGKIIFSAKILTGVAHATFVLAGVMKVSYKTVLKYSIPGGVIWSTGLALLGFYFGGYATSITRFLSRGGLILFGVLVCFLLYKFWLGRFVSERVNYWRNGKAMQKVKSMNPFNGKRKSRDKFDYDSVSARVSTSLKQRVKNEEILSGLSKQNSTKNR